MRYWGIYNHKEKLVTIGKKYPLVYCIKSDADLDCSNGKDSVHEVEIIKKHKKGGSK